MNVMRQLIIDQCHYINDEINNYFQQSFTFHIKDDLPDMDRLSDMELLKQFKDLHEAYISHVK